MNAILVDAPGGRLALHEVADPVPAPHAAVVEVRATGVCRSDWHAWMGHDPTVAFPHVPGHEFAGVVRAVGAEVRAVRPGQRVTAPFCCGCGRCPTCRDGVQNLCEREYQPGFDGWGSWADAVAVPWADVNVVPLPDELGFEEAASLGCRFMTGYAGLVDRAGLRAGETLAVIGCGGLGLSAVMIGAAIGATVIGVDVHEEKLALARELGATVTVDARAVDPVAAIREATGGGAHVTVDALGSADTCRQGVQSLRRRGRHVQLGLLLGDQATPPVPMLEVIKRELVVTGGHGMPARRYPEMLRFVLDGGVKVGALIGERRPLAEANEAMTAMTRFATRGVPLLLP